MAATIALRSAPGTNLHERRARRGLRPWQARTIRRSPICSRSMMLASGRASGAVPSSAQAGTASSATPWLRPGNSGDAAFLDGVLALLGDASPLVRGMAVWATRKLGPAEFVAALKAKHYPEEREAGVLAEWDCDLMNNLFVFGLGYSASAIGALLEQKRWQVLGTARSAAKFEALKAQGLTPVLFSDADGIARALANATHCLVSAPPGEAADPVLATYAQALHAAARLHWIGYLSTIGVYGDFQGAWVVEDTPSEPDTERGFARLKAEAAWTEFCRERGLPLDIFRLAGIYGPGRSPLDRIRLGEARRIVKPGQVFNRIHVDDIARTVAAAIFQERQEPGTRVFNAADDAAGDPRKM